MIRILLIAILVFYKTNLWADVFDLDREAGRLRSTAPHIFSDPKKTDVVFLDERFQFTNNLNNQVASPLLPGQNISSLLMDVKKSPLINIQYSSPAEADLLKFYLTLGQMRLGMFYEKMEALEKRYGGVLGVLRDQGVYDCLHKGDAANLPKRLVECSSKKDFQALLDSEGKTDKIVIMKEVANTLHKGNDTLDTISDIIPDLVVSLHGYTFNGPQKRISEVFSVFREDFMTKFNAMVSVYKQDHDVDVDDLNELSLPMQQMSASNIRDYVMLDPSKQNALLDQWSSSWAMAKTQERYELALEWLDHALMHPKVKEGYKAVLDENKKYVLRELSSFDRQIDRYRHFTGSIDDVVEASEQERSRLLGGRRHEE